jgi:hypothetical protein
VPEGLVILAFKRMKVSALGWGAGLRGRKFKGLKTVL